MTDLHIYMLTLKSECLTYGIRIHTQDLYMHGGLQSYYPLGNVLLVESRLTLEEFSKFYLKDIRGLSVMILDVTDVDGMTHLADPEASVWFAQAKCECHGERLQMNVFERWQRGLLKEPPMGFGSLADVDRWLGVYSDDPSVDLLRGRLVTKVTEEIGNRWASLYE